MKCFDNLYFEPTKVSKMKKQDYDLKLTWKNSGAKILTVDILLQKKACYSLSQVASLNLDFYLTLFKEQLST
jgi:hypothetical protein